MLKNIFFILVLIFSVFFQVNWANAACSWTAEECAERQAASDARKAATEEGIRADAAAYDAKKSASSSSDPVSESAKSITAPPSTKVTKMADGSVSRTVTIPGNDAYSVGTITRPDGTVDKVTTFKGADGSVVTELTRPDGTTVSATKDADGNYSWEWSAAWAAALMENGAEQIITITSEKVPGASCECIAEWGCYVDVAKRKYECTSGKGLSGFQRTFAEIIRYVINIVLLLGVLAVAGLGIAWSFAGGDDIKMKSTLKKWAINIIVWLIILFMFGYILRFLAPWVYE